MLFYYRHIQKQFSRFRALTIIFLMFFLSAQRASAINEPYINELKGTNIAAGHFFTVADEKFGDATAWSLIQQNISVNDLISFEINFDTSIYFYSQPFSCTVNFKIFLYTNPSDTTLADSTTYSNLNLRVQFDTAAGKPYKGIAMFKFDGIYRYKVKIISITSPELGTVPPIFRLKGEVIVDRKYNFSDNSTDVTRYTVVNGNQLKLEWTPANYPGAEMFDLEYAVIDSSSQIAASIRTYESGGDYSVPADSLTKWFKYNGTRISTASSNYLLNVPYDSGYVLFRIRGVQVHYPDDVRWEGNWNYSARQASAGSCGGSCPSGVVFFAGHEVLLNWQYSATFAEEGKKKEIITYYDGRLANRQSVTINNTDNRTIIQESIYDILGRPVVNILPAPADDSTLHYFKGFNKNTGGDPYSYSDLSYSSCSTTAAGMDSSSGTSKYYSANNSFLSSFYYAKYIPAARNYPFATTQYVDDNTGRINAQGGVGSTFQIGSGHETRYFYGKPTQIELDRLFGNEAGSASHYLKNMVVDPNGEISVSYVNSTGKTIATALAGAAPSNLHPLPSSSGASVQVSNELMTPQDFSRNVGDLSISASSTFLAPVTGTYLLNYKIDPLTYQKLYGPAKDSVICSNCYYDLEIIVKDKCDSTLRSETRSAGNVFDTACGSATTIQDTISVSIASIGEYYVSYILHLSQDALNFYDSVHIEKNSDIKHLNYFLLEELKNTDFYGCYNNCETCIDKLGVKSEFVDMFRTLYAGDSLQFGTADSLWVNTLYDSLYAHCQDIQSECTSESVCDEKLALLKMDVTPGGQYALYDSNYHLLEVPINVLARRSEISWFPDEAGNRDSVMLYNVNGEDSLKVPVKTLSDSLFIANWKDSWADSLVRLHPEYCYYLWCLANSASYEFDKEVQEWEDADTVMAMGWFDPNNYHALLDHDPFFSGIGNIGRYNKMKDSLRLFSRTLLRLSQTDKNILQFVDIILYCKGQSNGWNDCHPDSACRSRNREWFLYKNLYLNLKQRFYEQARRTSSNPVFSSCVNCHIGKDLIDLGIACSDPLDYFKAELLEAFEHPFPAGALLIKYTRGSQDGTTYTYTGNPVKLYVDVFRSCGQTDTVVQIFYPLQQIGVGLGAYGLVYHPSDSLTCEEEPNQADSVKLIGIECDTIPYVPFVDSTCNYHCPGGIYNPYDRDSISFYIEYGNPHSPPSGTPSGYAGCQYYSEFDIKTGSSSSCKFLNVWVCIYDSTCPSGGVCHMDSSYSSQCAATGSDTLYRNKIRRYPEYVDADNLINQILSNNPQHTSQQSEQQVLNECADNCAAQADYWINVLRRCNMSYDDSIALRTAFINICSQGCSQTNPYGTSSLPSTVSATYHSFEEAIEGILGPGAVNDSCTAELLSHPYPYDKQPALEERVIFESNYDICHKLTIKKSAYLSSGFGGSFHQYLKTVYGDAYILDSLELDDLMNSCTNCNGILKNDIVLPLIFDPLSSDCLHCDSIQAALTAFQDKFPSLDSTNQDYEILFVNFFNHRFGFALTFDEYRSFLDSCAAHDSYTGQLCNHSVTVENNTNPNDCTIELFNTALTNAENIYIAYIDSVHRDFRNAWLTKCMNIQPSLKMTAELFEYHYTLYYYDQSGALVKTIPPEGVALLDTTQLANVLLFRKLQNEGCYQYSDSIKFNNNGQVGWHMTAFEDQPYTMEMMINLSSHADQVIVSKLTEKDFLGGAIHGHEGVVVRIDTSKLKISLYGLHLGNTDSTIAVSVAGISNLLPLNTWTHLAIQRTGNLFDPVRIFVNGQQIAFNYTANNLSNATAFSGDSSFIVGSHNAGHLYLPGKLRGTVKNLRVYNRLLGADELRQNAFNPCQLASNPTGILFWSAMNNADSNKVLDLFAKTKGILTGFTWSPFAGVFNPHRLPSTYHYNSLDQVLQQFSPDGDTSKFYYDRLGRLTVSQNKQQKEDASYSGAANRYSYTKYDALGRITEVGEKSGADSIHTINLLDDAAVQAWLVSGTDRQVTKTIYDNPIDDYQVTTTSRKRVVASVYLENGSDHEGDSTLYAYDILGNVHTLVQHIMSLVAADAANGKKMINYDFDLASGKVNMVSYQEGKGDQFFYKYAYDADNRVIRSYSSRDKLVWIEDASYNYYLHGPLARTELGNYKVQGVDYAYTLQGWLKSINADTLDASKEIGGDGYYGSIFSRVSRDVYAFKLGYYNNDYAPVGSGATALAMHGYTPPGSLDEVGDQLFNGNISYSFQALSKISGGITDLRSYGYDQLNRLVGMRMYTPGTSLSNSDFITSYKESIAYDANGNILQYLRNGLKAVAVDMDSLSYKYNRDVNGNLLNNKLVYVKDPTSAGNYSVDIDDQHDNNYDYDRIGNLISDESENIHKINWTVYGKIKMIDKSSTTMTYGYNSGGERTYKNINDGKDSTLTWYVRDAQGNVLAVYSQKDADAIKWDEQHLYGSSRLGMWTWAGAIPASPPVVSHDDPSIQDSLMLGSRNYELTNHLGNVMSVISDKKIGNDSSSIVNFYVAEVLSQVDYYPFGMEMPSRRYEAGAGYRYGFNGKENDNEVKGEGNQQDYGMRVYDPRLGRFLSVDPLTNKYPALTPFQFASNCPIAGIDLDGGEILPVNSSIYLQTYSGFQTSLGQVNIYDVKKVYENIPKALRDPETHDLMFTLGGPVTAFGRDWDPEKDGAIVYRAGRYYNRGPKFSGAAESSPEPSASTKPVGKSYDDDVMSDPSAATKTGNTATAIQEGAGILSNQLNVKVWDASRKEQDNRATFYYATNLIDRYINNKRIGDKSLTTGEGRANLINFIVDGTMPIGNSKIEDLSLPDLEKNLRIVYTGIQILYKERLQYQQEFDKTLQPLISSYKAKGGKLNFEKLYEFKRPKN
jgi:RHS repeat-associated protein